MHLLPKLIYLCNGYYNIQENCEIVLLMMTLLKFKSAPPRKKIDVTQKGSPILCFHLFGLCFCVKELGGETFY
jgi:hypothetical protein